MSEWSVWRDINDFDDFGKCCGVYKLRLTDQVGGPSLIGRFLGCDHDGLLAIGQSVNLARRIKEFRDAYAGKRFLRHSVGDRLFLVRLCQHTSLKLNNVRVQIAVMKLENKVAAQAAEENLLKKYFKGFGELPPLNSNMPDTGGWDRVILAESEAISPLA
jgi:hypothetical protein